MENIKEKLHLRWMLVLYDIVIYAVACVLLMSFCRGVPLGDLKVHGIMLLGSLVIFRFAGNIYKQIWRYGGIQCYIRLLFADMAAYIAYFLVGCFIMNTSFTLLILMFAVSSVHLLGTLAIRMIYRYAFKYGIEDTWKGKILRFVLKIFSDIDNIGENETQKIKVAIIGAGRLGVSLAEELINNSASSYVPRCFIDKCKEKVGREIHGISVIGEDENTFNILKEYGIQEIIFAIHSMDANEKKRLYDLYKQTGCKLKVYDYPLMQSAGSKRHLREFDIEELLFRKPIVVTDERTEEYYRNKVVLVTGGGGSIGSELCRQLAKKGPKSIIIMDIYENGAYDVQQELNMIYGDTINIKVEIASITNKAAMRRIFDRHHPEILINAAAHKHVPLMEDNPIEAVENNIFGTKVLVDLCEEYKIDRFMMVSTDKAVNPTNVMGATKRMCEMIVQSASEEGTVKYSATRFGNVLGSAGSVVHLFKRQIAEGGPVTVTDKRIIRYFMTIPEASQLVLQSGAMANNGELFVLDMGEPVKIYDLATNMIELSGVKDVEIIETGLRPGEKLYEELLVQSDNVHKTDNDLIFIEKDDALPRTEVLAKLKVLEDACKTEDRDNVKAALHRVVPTYRTPEEVNCGVE